MSKKQSESNETAASKALPSSSGSGWGELEVIAKGLELNGFELSRGTCKGTNCEWATLDIRRPANPEWLGVWQAVESDGEIGTVIRLIGQAYEEWIEYEEAFIQNTEN